jgi:hypothetical protein
LSAPVRLGANQFQFTITGPAAQVCQVLSSTNLLQWSLLTTVTNTNGTLQFIDTSPTISAKFYRVEEQ